MRCRGRRRILIKNVLLNKITMAKTGNRTQDDTKHLVVWALTLTTRLPSSLVLIQIISCIKIYLIKFVLQVSNNSPVIINEVHELLS